jgi:hypothetical protein
MWIAEEKDPQVLYGKVCVVHVCVYVCACIIMPTILGMCILEEGIGIMSMMFSARQLWTPFPTTLAKGFDKAVLCKQFVPYSESLFIQRFLCTRPDCTTTTCIYEVSAGVAHISVAGVGITF